FESLKFLQRQLFRSFEDWKVSSLQSMQRGHQFGSDTRPPMPDKTDFASWQQRIRLYCQGKENGVPHLGPELGTSSILGSVTGGEGIGRQNRGQGNNGWGTGVAGYGGAQNRVWNVYSRCDELPRFSGLSSQCGNVFQADAVMLTICVE
ncbi:hypothetical protein Tco_1114846, partial [Tanacetum coccineum]